MDESPTGEVRRFWRRMAWLAPLPVLAVVINYALDPGGIFSRGNAEREIASWLIGGSNVANARLCDERLLQKEAIERLRPARQVIVLGSSRSMLIGADLFPGTSFFNHSVAGATIEDDIAIWEIYRRQPMRPSTVIVGIDPWTLNREHGQLRWRTLYREYAAALARHGMPPPAGSVTPRRYLELVSPFYLQRSVAKWMRLRANGGDRDTYYATESDIGEMDIVRADGTTSYGRQVRSRSVDEVRLLALASTVEQPVYGLENFAALDRRYQQQFEMFLDDLKSDGVRVVIFLSPYQPDVYAHLQRSPKYGMVPAAESYLRRVAMGRRLSLLGSYDPARAGCDPAEFYDAYHARESCVERIVRRGGATPPVAESLPEEGR